MLLLSLVNHKSLSNNSLLVYRLSLETLTTRKTHNNIESSEILFMELFSNDHCV
jgi:hypothetical protein